jgi:hypothetical protein
MKNSDLLLPVTDTSLSICSATATVPLWQSSAEVVLRNAGQLKTIKRARIRFQAFGVQGCDQYFKEDVSGGRLCWL